MSEAVLKGNDLVKLSQFLINDLFTHRVTNTVSVDENVLWHLTIEFSVALESALEVIRKNCGRDNLLAFDWLRTGLSIVFAEIGIVCCTEANGTLLAFMTNINSDKHGLI